MRGVTFILIPLLFFGALGLYFLYGTQSDSPNQEPAYVNTAAKEEKQNRFRMELGRYLAIAHGEGVEQALKTLRVEMEQDPFVSAYCHEVAHEIGRVAYDTRVSVSDVLQQQDDVCASGYMHGLFEGMFAAENNVASTSAYLGGECRKLPDTMSERGQCFHGIGHGLMYALDNELPESIRVCGQFEGQRKKDCESGAYMENFNSDQHLHPSEYLSATDFFYPCGEQELASKATCYLYAPIYFLNTHDQNYDSALAWCGQAPRAFRDDCYMGIGYQVARRNALYPAVSEAVCRRSAEMVRECLWGVLVMHLWINDIETESEAVSVCEKMGLESRPDCTYFAEAMQLTDS